MTEAIHSGNYQMPMQRMDAPATVSTAAPTAVPTATKAGKIDLSRGALEFRLNDISMAFTRALKKIAANGVEEQKSINAKLDTLNKVLNALQKLEQGAFSAKDLYTPQDIPISSAAARRAMERITARADDEYRIAKEAAVKAERAVCKEVEDWEWRKVSAFKSGYERMKMSIPEPEYMTAESNGNIRYWGFEKAGEKKWIWYEVPVQGNFWYPSWAPDTIKAAYSAKQAIIGPATEKYEAMTSGVTLGSLLYSLGIYAESEDLPATKDELKIAATKISDMISSLESVESTLETDTNGINNNWQREIDQIAKRVDAFNASIKQLIDAAH